jgi:hypothetical protein
MPSSAQEMHEEVSALAGQPRAMGSSLQDERKSAGVVTKAVSKGRECECLNTQFKAQSPRLPGTTLYAAYVRPTFKLPRRVCQGQTCMSGRGGNESVASADNTRIRAPEYSGDSRKQLWRDFTDCSQGFDSSDESKCSGQATYRVVIRGA